MTKIYGIKNCDTMKKAFTWLEEKGINYEFIDFKKTQPDEKILRLAIKEHGWETVINKRGTTWRKLPDDVQNNMDETKAVSLTQDNPSIIKRPLLVHNEQTHIGFKPDQYENIF